MCKGSEAKQDSISIPSLSVCTVNDGLYESVCRLSPFEVLSGQAALQAFSSKSKCLAFRCGQMALRTAAFKLISVKVEVTAERL